MENRFCVQVTSYCNEEDLVVWRSFLEKKGYETITKKAMRQGSRKMSVPKYALFRNLSGTELQEIEDGKIKISFNNLIMIKQDLTTVRDMTLIKCVCISCDKEYIRTNVKGNKGLCPKCRSRANTGSGYDVRQSANKRKQEEQYDRRSVTQ